MPSGAKIIITASLAAVQLGLNVKVQNIAAVWTSATYET